MLQRLHLPKKFSNCLLIKQLLFLTKLTLRLSITLKFKCRKDNNPHKTCLRIRLGKRSNCQLTFSCIEVSRASTSMYNRIDRVCRQRSSTDCSVEPNLWLFRVISFKQRPNPSLTKCQHALLLNLPKSLTTTVSSWSTEFRQ